MAEFVESENIDKMDETFDSLEENIQNLQKEYTLKQQELHQIQLQGLHESDEKDLMEKYTEIIKMESQINLKQSQLESMCNDEDARKKLDDFVVNRMVNNFFFQRELMETLKSQMKNSDEFLNDFKSMTKELKQSLGDLEQNTESETPMPASCADLLKDLKSEATVTETNEEVAEEAIKFFFKLLKLGFSARLSSTDCSTSLAICDNGGDNGYVVNDESNTQGAMVESNQEPSILMNIIDTFLKAMGESNREPSEIMAGIDFFGKLIGVTDGTKTPEASDGTKTPEASDGTKTTEVSDDTKTGEVSDDMKTPKVSDDKTPEF